MIKKVNIFNQNNIFSVLFTLFFLLGSFVLFLAKLSPTVGYEASIYTSTPVILWIYIFSSTIFGVLIIIHYISNKKLDRDKLWLVGLYLIYFNYIVCLSLFVIRGYYMWCMNGDVASHIGRVNEILSTGNLPGQLFYPILHIYTSQIILVTNIDIITLHKIVPLFFGILYVPFIYLFSKSVLSEKSQIILSTMAGCTFINGWYISFIPYGLAALYFPLFLYVLFKVNSVNSVRWEVLVSILVILYPLFHPIMSFIIIVIIVALYLGKFIVQNIDYIKNALSKEEKTQFTRLKIPKFKLTLLGLVIVVSIMWVSSFYVWRLILKMIYAFIINEYTTTQASNLLVNINYAQKYGYNVVENALKAEGGPLFYILIAIISFPIVWKNKGNKRIYNLLLLYSPLLLISIIMITFYFVNLLFSPLRLVTYTTIISTPLIGYLLNFFIHKVKINNIIKNEHKKFFTFCLVGMIILLIITWINGILVLYPSPYTLSISYHSPESEVKGMSWILENRNVNLAMTGMNIDPFRYGSLLLTEKQRQLQHMPEFSQASDVPYHFGYDNNSLLSSYYNQGVYLLNPERDKRIYTDIFPKMAKIRWVPEDFKKLDYDISINEIYSNEKFNIYKVSGSEKK